MKTSVVIPNWNGQTWIGECLDSLLLQSIKTQIIVVDNGSIDKSVEIIKKNYPAVILIELPVNTGFAGGVNRGIEHALNDGAEAIALLNNDAVANKNWLRELVAAMEENPKLGIAACKLKHISKEYFDSTGDFYSIWGLPFPRARNVKDTGQYNKSELIFSGSGGASLYRSEMLQQIGLFDERFFAYYEDVDISFRAQLHGWLVSYQPKSEAYHRISATSSKMGSFTRYHSTKNFFLLYLKNMPGWIFWKYLPYFLIQSLRMFVSSIIHRRFITFIKAFSKVIILLPGVFIDRHKIQKSRSVSVKYIDSLLYKKRPV